MGRRFLDLAVRVSGIPVLAAAQQRASANGIQVHLAPCFGLVAGALTVECEAATCAYLQQSITALVSCCQRLLPLGQTRAHEILWNLKPAIVRAATSGRSMTVDRVPCFTPLLDVASAQHPAMRTRLFMS
jgi:urease accessory protein